MTSLRKVADNQYIELKIHDNDKGETRDFENVSVHTTIERLEQAVSMCTIFGTQILTICKYFECYIITQQVRNEFDIPSTTGIEFRVRNAPNALLRHYTIHLVRQMYHKSFDNNTIYFKRTGRLNDAQDGAKQSWYKFWEEQKINCVVVLILFCFVTVYYLIMVGTVDPPTVSPTTSPTIHPGKIEHLFYVFQVHQALGTLICDIAREFEVKTDPNGKNCNINPDFTRYYHNMDHQIEYMISESFVLLGNEHSMAKMGTFAKYHIRNCPNPNDINNNIPQIHFATILRDPRELLVAQYLAATPHGQFNEDEFMKHVKETKFRGGSLIWRFSGDYCGWETDGGPIVLSESRFEVCNEIAHKWLDMFEIVCFVDNMDLCIEYMIKNYFCKANDKHCKDVLNPLITKFQNDKFSKDALRVKDKTQQREQHSLLTWHQIKQSLFKNQTNVLFVEDIMKYEVKLYDQMKEKCGNGKFEKYSTIAKNYGC